MLRLGRGTLGCIACAEIYAQRPPQISRKVAQLIMSSEFTVILPCRLSLDLLSFCYCVTLSVYDLKQTLADLRQIFSCHDVVFINFFRRVQSSPSQSDPAFSVDPIAAGTRTAEARTADVHVVTGGAVRGPATELPSCVRTAE